MSVDFSSRASAAPSTVPAGSLALGSPSTAIPGVERLCFTFQLRELVITAPSKYLSHHSFYVKWERGRSYRGKFHPVACPAAVAADGVHVAVPLPMTHQFSFEVNLHQKATDSSTFEKKLMEMSVTLFRYTDQTKEEIKSRAVVATTKIDLRTLLENVRVNVSMNARLPLSDHEYIDCVFVVAPAGAVQPTIELDAASAASAARLTLREQHPPSSLRFEECGDSAQAIGIADASIRALAERLGVASQFTPLVNLMDQGTVKAVPSSMSVQDTFQLLAGSGVGEFATMLHSVRGDVGYSEVPWTLTGSGSTGHKSLSYMMRLGKDKTFRCEEHTLFCAAGDDVFVHSSSRAPDVPMVGGSCRLEFLVHISTGEGEGRGTVVAVYAHLHIPSDTLRRMVSSKAAVQLERLVLTAEQVLLQILSPRSSRRTIGTRGTDGVRNSASLRSSRRFRRSVTRTVVAQSSLDPNLWRRLLDHGTLPYPQLVLQTLQRLQQGSITKVTEVEIAALESIAVYHRGSEQIVRVALGIVSQLCRGSGASIIVTLSPTLSVSLRSVVELYDPGTFGDFEAVLQRLESETSALRQSKLGSMTRSRQFWQELERNIGSEDMVDQCLAMIIESRMHLLSDTHIALLTTALSLHLASERVCQSVFQLMADVRDASKITLRLSTAIERAAALHPGVAVRFPRLVEKAALARAAASPFDAAYGHLLNEQPRFECKVVFSTPKRGSAMCYLTRTHLCAGAYCVPLSSIKKIVTMRVMLQPAVAVYLSSLSGPADFVFVTWSRKELLQELSDMGFFALIQQS